MRVALLKDCKNRDDGDFATATTFRKCEEPSYFECTNSRNTRDHALFHHVDGGLVELDEFGATKLRANFFNWLWWVLATDEDPPEFLRFQQFFLL